jgi:hypothetical protein
VENTLRNPKEFFIYKWLIFHMAVQTAWQFDKAPQAGGLSPGPWLSEAAIGWFESASYLSIYLSIYCINIYIYMNYMDLKLVHMFSGTVR